ncbi:hypothetical protein VP01_1020g4 [Puccinia sorghi]|uniref:Uncharacterized protein n=1 Tax=Puccinia sorghi TaxID=27349 RepID=A0A0L6VW66_9BASI|nr:hypothetical protein VP01_1020g4 [Puccinia sorghi]
MREKASWGNLLLEKVTFPGKVWEVDWSLFSRNGFGSLQGKSIPNGKKVTLLLSLPSVMEKNPASPLAHLISVEDISMYDLWCGFIHSRSSTFLFKISSHFISTKRFNNKTLNQIISLWLLQQTIPQNQVYDSYLQEVFNYCEPGATLLKQNWAVTSGKKLLGAAGCNAQSIESQ